MNSDRYHSVLGAFYLVMAGVSGVGLIAPDLVDPVLIGIVLVGAVVIDTTLSVTGVVE